MSDPLKMPRGLDDPHQVLLWSVDELVPFLTFLVIGVMMQQVLFFGIVGFALSRILRRYKDQRPDGFLLHIIYWFGFMPERGRVVPNPFRRKWHQ